MIRILDGYWLDNPSDDYDSVEIPVPNNSEAVIFGWSQSNKHSTMVIHMQFLLYASHAEGSGEYMLLHQTPNVGPS